MARRARDWSSIAVALLLFGACAVMVVRGLAAAADPALPVDDAYISFSYARTLAAGGGLRLTPAADPVEGFSNPLWVAILSLAGGLGSSIAPTAVLLALLAAVATVIAVFGTARLLVKERWLPLLAAWAFALAPGLGFHVAAGLETLVTGLALLLAFRFLVSAPPGAMDRRTAVALLALALLRPEGVLVFLAWVVLLRRSGRLSASGVLVFAIPFGAFLLFRWAYFGQLLPNSVAAKMGLDVLTALRLGLAYLLEFAGRNAPVIALGAAGMWWTRRRDALAALVVCATLTLLALGGAHADGYPFQRYLFPLLPILLVFAARGARALFEFGERRGRSGIAAAAAGLVLAVGFQAILWGIADPEVGRARFALFDGWHARLEASTQATRRFIAGDRVRPEVSRPPYHQLAAWLRERAQPGQLVAMQEIGITSYYSGLEVLDTFGLADAQIAQAQGPPSGKAAPDYVFGRAPEFFVIRLAANALRPGLLADRVYATQPRMALEYSLARWFPAAGPRLIAVFVRRAGLATAVSLVDRVPEPARFTSPAPAYLGEALQQEDAETPALAAAGRLHFKRWLRGVQWNRNDVEGAATLAVDIPDGGTPLFEVTIAPGRPEAAGRYEISIAPLPGSREAAVGASAETGDGVAARDLSVDLSRWRGQRVGVKLRFEATDRSRASSPGWLIWMEPRLVVLRGASAGNPTPAAAIASRLQSVRAKRD